MIISYDKMISYEYDREANKLFIRVEALDVNPCPFYELFLSIEFDNRIFTQAGSEVGSVCKNPTILKERMSVRSGIFGAGITGCCINRRGVIDCGQGYGGGTHRRGCRGR